MLNEGETGCRSPHARKGLHLDIIILRKSKDEECCCTVYRFCMCKTFYMQHVQTTAPAFALVWSL
jgi:hypothetical protein